LHTKNPQSQTTNPRQYTTTPEQLKFLIDQEANVTYVVDGHMGEYRPEPKDLGQRVKAWLSDPALIEMMSANSKRAARPTASLDIAREILEVMTEHARPLEDGDAGKFSPLLAPPPATTSPLNPEQEAAGGLESPFPSGDGPPEEG
jgi:hypothetical protein